MEKWIAAVVVVLLLGYYLVSQKEIRHGPGQVAPKDPVQRTISNGKSWEVRNEYSITPLAEFEIEARVLHRRGYSYGRESDLSPLDLALGWGPMSDETVLDKIKITQGGRFYYWRVHEYPIPRKDIISHSTNMHILPANDEVARRIKDVRAGHVIHLKGKLVGIVARDGWRWRSSLSRTDSGWGACELVWTEEFEIVDEGD